MNTGSFLIVGRKFCLGIVFREKVAEKKKRKVYEISVILTKYNLFCNGM
jgi:hypothetical protein